MFGLSELLLQSIQLTRYTCEWSYTHKYIVCTNHLVCSWCVNLHVYAFSTSSIVSSYWLVSEFAPSCGAMTLKAFNDMTSPGSSKRECQVPPATTKSKRYVAMSTVHGRDVLVVMPSWLQYILSRLDQLNCTRWNITQHSFEDSTPFGTKPFTNIIATLDPEVDRRLVLAAHYDSKFINGFLGATDSALSVALLLDLALTLDQKLCDRQVRTNHTVIKHAQYLAVYFISLKKTWPAPTLRNRECPG